MFITLTHANTKNKAEVFKDKIFAFYESPAMKCTLVVADAGGVFPVLETEEEIKSLLNNKEIENVGTN